MSEKKRYLGDGVYAEDDGYHIRLTTEDGVGVRNLIYLEPAVMAALVKFDSDTREFLRQDVEEARPCYNCGAATIVGCVTSNAGVQVFVDLCEACMKPESVTTRQKARELGVTA